MFQLEKKSQSPLYQQLMVRLRNDIKAGVYVAGGRIPSEMVLCSTYGVSRVTVRKAVSDLVQEGLLVRMQGKGTFVAEEKIQRDLQHITSFTEACLAMGHTVSSKIISTQLEMLSAQDNAKLKLVDNEKVISISRVRYCDKKPVLLEVNHYPSRYDFLLTADNEGSQYQVLKQHGIIPSSAIHDISLGHANQFVSKHLTTTKEGDALLLLHELVFDQYGEPLHMSQQWICGDLIVFRI